MVEDLFLSGSNYSINCNCSRWDVQDYSIIVETWLKKDDLNTLRTNLRPGAVSELYNILGRPFYVDKSCTAANTLKISANPNSRSNHKNMKRDTIIYPKNVSLHPLDSPKGWVEIKIEGFSSGNSSL